MKMIGVWIIVVLYQLCAVTCILAASHDKRALPIPDAHHKETNTTSRTSTKPLGCKISTAELFPACQLCAVTYILAAPHDKRALPIPDAHHKETNATTKTSIKPLFTKIPTEELCPRGYLPQTNGKQTLCCRPVLCSPGFEIKTCQINFGQDVCAQCLQGFLQVNNISSFNMEEGSCFKNPYFSRRRGCSLEDHKVSPTQPKNCAMFCECRTEDCYVGNPCACGMVDPCGVNQWLNKKTKKCEACPPYSYKTHRGCGRCTYNLTAFSHGLTMPVTTTEQPTTTITRTTNGTGTGRTSESMKNNAEKDNLLWMKILVVIIVIIIVTVSVSCGAVFLFKYFQKKRMCISKRLCPPEAEVINNAVVENPEERKQLMPDNPEKDIENEDMNIYSQSIQKLTSKRQYSKESGYLSNEENDLNPQIEMSTSSHNERPESVTWNAESGSCCIGNPNLANVDGAVKSRLETTEYSTFDYTTLLTEANSNSICIKEGSKISNYKQSEEQSDNTMPKLMYDIDHPTEDASVAHNGKGEERCHLADKSIGVQHSLQVKSMSKEIYNDVYHSTEDTGVAHNGNYEERCHFVDKSIGVQHSLQATGAPKEKQKPMATVAPFTPNEPDNSAPFTPNEPDNSVESDDFSFETSYIRGNQSTNSGDFEMSYTSGGMERDAMGIGPPSDSGPEGMSHRGDHEVTYLKEPKGRKHTADKTTRNENTSLKTPAKSATRNLPDGTSENTGVKFVDPPSEDTYEKTVVVSKKCKTVAPNTGAQTVDDTDDVDKHKEISEDASSGRTPSKPVFESDGKYRIAGERTLSDNDNNMLNDAIEDDSIEVFVNFDRMEASGETNEQFAAFHQTPRNCSLEQAAVTRFLKESDELSTDGSVIKDEVEEDEDKDVGKKESSVSSDNLNAVDLSNDTSVEVSMHRERTQNPAITNGQLSNVEEVGRDNERNKTVKENSESSDSFNATLPSNSSVEISMHPVESSMDSVEVALLPEREMGDGAYSFEI